ncbi:hypothetical protein LAD12857_02610 [Lacrimispora amygdalina]|uniref:Uncharacterized protein n=1 Tax=Lacrimispora amygdalina TaxID=253257 RepID=A0ABQ5M040_9FIRM|nr:hypothetical protein [Clostridium indicum]
MVQIGEQIEEWERGKNTLADGWGINNNSYTDPSEALLHENHIKL